MRPDFLRSSIFVVTGLLVTCPVLAAPPSPPTPCTAGAGLRAGILVSWTDVAGETGYRIDRNGVPIIHLPAGTTSFTDVELPGPGTFTYCVVAFANADTSAPACADWTVATPAVWFHPAHALQDAFPFTENPALPGTSAFDTCAALVKTGWQTSPPTGGLTRIAVQGDTLVANAPGEDVRVDLVFRVRPGPGNYVTAGQTLSGLRRVPTSSNPASPGDSTFWGRYLADNGAFGTGGNGITGPGHPGGTWNALRWNSARCDTAELNLFPVESRGNLPALTPGAWATMLHEDDPKFAVLGIPKNRCFLVDPAGPVDHTNITCAAVPAWATAEAGFDGQAQTREYTKILPDGLFTAGTSIQYFVRRSTLPSPMTASLAPDTTIAIPQIATSSLDCHRWEQWRALPDRWKSTNHGGLGDACALLLNLDDGQGSERTFCGVADTLGATAVSRYGAHNGWQRSGYNGGTLDPNDPAHFVRGKNSQPGTVWDLYTVRGGHELIHGSAGAFGNRLGPKSSAGSPLAGREARSGPTPFMLRRYYRMLIVVSGTRDTAILGPVADRGADDVALIHDFLQTPGGTSQPRGLHVQGSGFAQAEAAEAALIPSHATFLSSDLACGLRHASYRTLSGNLRGTVDLFPTTLVSPRGDVFGVRSDMSDDPDVLITSAGGTAAAFYSTMGGGPAPYVASVRTSSAARISLMDAFSTSSIGNRFGESALAHHHYFEDVWANVFGALCPLASTGVPLDPSGTVELGITNNPLSFGISRIRFTVEQNEVVCVSVHDPAGRTVCTLFDGALPAGHHELVWDGRSPDGSRLSPGVYFVQVRTGLRTAARKLVLLH